MKTLTPLPNYNEVLGHIVVLLEQRRARVPLRSVNTIMTATYWEIGRQIVEGEQKAGGPPCRRYRQAIFKLLFRGLVGEIWKGFLRSQLAIYAAFYSWAGRCIRQTPFDEFYPLVQTDL